MAKMMSRFPLSDKLCHFVLFGTLAFIVHRAFGCDRLFSSRAVLLTCMVVVLVLAEEFTQIWLPNRNFDLGDITADLAGIVVFSAFAYFGMQRRMDA